MGVFGVIFLSVPFYFLWNYLAPIYLPQLPPVYLHVPFWHCVGIFGLAAIFRLVFFPQGACCGWGWCRKRD